MATPSRRRWFRFNLSTLLIAVALASIPLGWIGWQINFVRQREAALKWIDAHDGAAANAWNNDLSPQVPIFRDWLGDRGWAVIYLEADTTDEDVDRISRLFPEAEVWRGTIRRPPRGQVCGAFG